MARQHKSPPTGRGTRVFDGLPEARRRQVKGAARAVFARDGYTGANVNEIAERAGISVGALYKYFRTKDDLFLVHIEEMHERLEAGLAEIEASPGTLFDKIERVITAAIAFAEAEPELMQLYVLCTTQALAPLAGHLSRRIETLAAETYRRLLEAARASGEISPDVDPAFDAFCLDNLLMATHFSYGTRYYRERLRIFAGPGWGGRPQEYVARLMIFLRRALGADVQSRRRSLPRASVKAAMKQPPR